jgi:RND family efflux transporter MFP subunit
VTKRTITLLIVALLVVGSALWWRFGRAPLVTAASVTRGTAAEIVYATGGVEPVRWAKVASVIRDRIVDICDCEGRPVKRGDLLVRLDDREVQAQLQDLRAREDFLKREMTRVSELIARGAATTQAYERASMDLRQVQAQIQVQIEKINDYSIVAPMDGLVLRRDGEIGEIAEAGQILFRVGVPKPLQVVAEVNEEDVPRVKLGQTVLLRTDAFPGQPLKAKVNEITPMGDISAKTFRVKMALPDDTPLHPGMSVEANIVTREKPNALLIPADALSGNAVFAIEGTSVHKRTLSIGLRGTREVEVADGLQEGERVASPALPVLKDGKRVRVAAP